MFNIQEPIEMDLETYKLNYDYGVYVNYKISYGTASPLQFNEFIDRRKKGLTISQIVFNEE